MKIKPFFRWYDLWIGMYWDRYARVLYVCPLPMLGIAISLMPKRNAYFASGVEMFPDGSVVRHYDVKSAYPESLINASYGKGGK
jgi:hypothetical protein